MTLSPLAPAPISSEIPCREPLDPNGRGRARGRRSLGALFSLLSLALPAGAAWAANADLQVSAYTWSPDPAVHGGTTTFAITVQNNGPASSTGSTLTVNLPANVTYLGNSSGCTPSGGNTVLTCPIGALSIAGTASVTYTATGGAATVASTDATVVDNTVGNSDPNGANDTLNKSVTSINGADLTVSNSGPASAVAGTAIDFTLVATNHGPDPASSFRVTDTLPALADFNNVTASGTGWSCTVNAGTSVVCNYTGAAVASGGSTSAITVHGTVVSSSGTISNGASIVTTDGSTGDPVVGNNTAANVVVTVTPGTSLRANKTMTGATLGETTRFLSGETVTLALSVTNQGPQAATGITLSDTVPAEFTISGATPSGCSVTGQEITCAVASLASGATSSVFNFTLTAPAVVSSTPGSNTATVVRTAPTGGSDTAATVNYTVVPPYAHLSISKTKGPTPVYADTDITSTIRVRNDPASPAAATGTITVYDTLNDYPNELYQSFSGAGWSCVDTTASDKKVTCTYAIPTTLAPGSYTDNLVIITRPAPTFTGGSLTNVAQTGNTHTPGDNNPGLTSTVSVYGTDQRADLAIVKGAYTPNPVTAVDNSFTYTLAVTNNGPANPGFDTAATVNIVDALPMYYSRNGTTGLGYAVDGGGFGAGESCTYSGGNVRCTLKNLANGDTRTVTVTVTRPVLSGTFNNVTATVSSPDTVDDTTANDSSSQSVTIVPVADVSISQVQAATDPVKAGVNELFTVSLRNDGPNPAANVTVQIPVDTTKVDLTSGPTLTGATGSCAAGEALSGTYAGQTGILCTIASLSDNESRQVSFQVMPKYSAYPVAGTYTTDADITTTTAESSTANNSNTRQVDVILPQLDLAVTLQEATGYSYGTHSGLLYDPVAYGDAVIYLVTVRNNGPSLATQVAMTQTPAPPGGYTMVYQGVTVDDSSTYEPAYPPTCSWDGTEVSCLLGDTLAHSQLPSNSYVALKITMLPGGGPDPASSLTFSNTAAVASAETLAGYDSQAANNSVVESTTVLPQTNLAVGVQAVQRDTTTELTGPVSLNEPFDYLVTVKNLGPSAATGVTLTDVLPTGLALTGSVTVTPGSGVTLTTNSCSGTTTISCNLGVIPADTSGVDDTKWVTIRIPVRAAYRADGSYSFGFLTNIADTATVAPMPNTSIDIDASNDSASVNVQVSRSSIAGTVYSDNNRSGDFTAGEGLNAVTLTISGTDTWGNTIAAKTTTTNASGAFTFNSFPSGSYQIVETQPATVYDGLETAGSAGGTTAGVSCDGVTNCLNVAAANTISAIALPANTAAIGYYFQNYTRATVTGSVYHDADNDGIKDAGETTGISGVSITVAGTGYNGQPVSVSGTTNAGGVYTIYVPPATGVGYTVTENAQPTGYLDGSEYDGTAMVAASAGRAAPESIILLTVNPGTTYGSRHFGELVAATLDGHVFLDADNDGVKDAGESSGVSGITITLTGTDDLGNAIDTTTTTGAAGHYTFNSGFALRPGSYTLTETAPAGLTASGSSAGSPAGTPGERTISAITLGSGINGAGYNFGESGQGVGGTVYVDLDGDDLLDPGEPGIAGVTVRLSGNAADGRDVCVVISPDPCDAVTDANGGYFFANLPASDATGYTLTEVQGAILADYGNGTAQAGFTLGGTAGTDATSHIVLPVGGMDTGYNFSEHGAGLDGTVFSQVSGNPGLAGVTMTLSGTTGAGANVCTRVPSCTATTAADGTFAFTGLPAGSYTFTETQPVDYAEGTNTAGSAGGTFGLSGSNTTVGVSLAAGESATGYGLGERLGSITGRVCVDADNNGVCAAGESGIAGVVMTLSGTTASGTDLCASGCPTATTDATGAFGFTDLRRANGAGYSVSEQGQAVAPLDDYLDGRTGTGANCAACAVVSTSPNAITGIAFDPALAYNFAFGELTAAGLSGAVYFDVDGDHTLDAGEALAGVTVTLSGTDDQGTAVNRTATTDADGAYTFTQLRPSGAGGYALTETQPAGIADGGVDLGSLGGNLAANAVNTIAVLQGESGTGYDFRDVAGILSGGVYLDANGSGARDGGEAPLAGVTVTLTGTDVTGTPVALTTASAADGSYAFIGLIAGNYVLRETEPVIYEPGSDTAGSAGGALSGTDTINAIALGAGVDGSGYLFAERPGNDAVVSGTVWFNSDTPDDLRQPGEPGLQGWRVEAWRAGALVSSTTTDADGDYTLSGLAPDFGYELLFRHPVNNAVYGAPISTEPGVDLSHDTIANLTVGSGAVIVDQSLPLDPSGVVYDAVTRLPLANVTVAITGPVGFDPALHLVGGVANQSQVTDATGYYQFLLLAGAPAGTYTLAVTAPGGYVSGPSALLPPQAGPLAVGALPNPNLISASNAPPPVGNAAVYYLAFGLSAASANVLNNHIPVDPVLGGAIVMTKQSPKLTVSRGELVPYTLTARNTLSAVLPNIAVVDRIPAGFKYVKGSATLGGIKTEPAAAGRTLTWSGLSFAVGETKELKLLLVVGSGVGDGDYVNQTWAMNTVADARVSNVASATVRVVPDPTFECSDLIGKVFDDRNRNGYQDEGEPGLPGVRIASARGWLMTTDAQGRYHVACAQVPDELRGSNFILKLDERTLPSGYRVTTENPRVVRLTQGKLAKLNFGAAIHRVVRLDLDARAFGEKGALSPAYAQRIDGVLQLLREGPSVLRLAYHMAKGEGEQQARERLRLLHEAIEKRWTPTGCCYDLLIEDEVVSLNGNGEVAQ